MIEKLPKVVFEQKWHHVPDFACLGVCLFPINVKTAESMRPTNAPGEGFGCLELQKFSFFVIVFYL